MSTRDPFSRSIRMAAVLVVALVVFAVPVMADNPCDPEDPSDRPDVIVGDIHEVANYGQVGGISAFAIGTWSCNIGTCWLNWIDNSNEHPLITQNVYRLKDGRFEHLGQSWLKHAFFALSLELCTDGCITVPDGAHLGVDCADPYSAALNGQQSVLGPKFEVNSATGEFPYPFTTIGQSGDAIYKRLQVHNDDLDPALNPGASYFVDSHYMAADDAAAQRDDNNSSWRPASFTPSGDHYDMHLDGTTVREQPGIYAWQAADPGVLLKTLGVPDDGWFVVANKVTDLGTGMWNYEYALFNYNSHRSAGSFRVPIPEGAIVENIGFHDVDYHSGEPYPKTDWSAAIDTSSTPHALVWQTESYATNPDANALRWDTLYNFRFDISVPSASGLVTVGLFRPGTPAEIAAGSRVPQLCDNDATCEVGENSCTCPADCGPPQELEFVCDDFMDDDCDGAIDCRDLDCCYDSICDGDGDLYGPCDDCDDDDDQIWATPGEVLVLDLIDNGPSNTLLTWTEPLEPGCTTPIYDVLRTESAKDWVQGKDCLPDGDPADTEVVETEVPTPEGCFYYLVRATSGCPEGLGPLGFDSVPAPRVGSACP